MTSAAFFSSDASAPVLTNTAGSFIALLDACLLNGYGSVAAVTGWQKVYTGTNKAAYRATSGNRFYLRVDDTDTDVVRMVGYESMTSVDIGVNPFPLDSQVSGGLYLRKTNAAAADSWSLFANSSCFYFFPVVNVGGSSSNDAGGQFFFGEFVSYRANDTFNTMIIGSPVSTLGVGYFANHGSTTLTGKTVIPGHYLARNFLGLTKSEPCSKYTGKIQLSTGAGATTRFVIGDYGTSVPAYPDPVSGKIPLMRLHIIEAIALTAPSQAGYAMRGYLPGIWVPVLRGFSSGDTMSGGDVLTGKSFQFITPHGRYQADGGTTPGMCAIETSNTW